MNNINKKLEELLSGENSQMLKNLAKSPEAQKLASSLSQESKNKLIEEFMKTDTAVLKQKLKNANGSLSGITPEQLKQLLR